MRNRDDSTEDLLRRLICRLLCQPRRFIRSRRIFAFKALSFTTEGESAMLTIKDTEVPGTVTATISYVDAKGKPAKVDGVPSWSVDNADVVDSLTPAADGLSATLHITDNVGACLLTIDADADLGSGVTDVITVDTISVIPGDAVAGNIGFSAVTPDA